MPTSPDPAPDDPLSRWVKILTNILFGIVVRSLEIVREYRSELAFLGKGACKIILALAIWQGVKVIKDKGLLGFILPSLEEPQTWRVPPTGKQAKLPLHF